MRTNAVPTDPANGPIYEGYQPLAGAYDEMMTAEGALRPHWQRFVQALQSLGSERLADRWATVQRLRFENGITFSAHAENPGAERPWELDAVPLMLSAQDWAGLEAGLRQRAALLNKVLADLYGPQTLLREGRLPAPVVLGNPRFLRPCHGILPRDGIFLHYYAADLGRGPDGRWWVLGDRCEAPEGVGFALENRIVLSHSFRGEFRDNQIQRLAGFFQHMHERLVALTRRDDPRIVLMSPGPQQPSYFAHSYLARYLGYTLAEGADLMVRDNRVNLKTLDGLKPVDLILRRLDADACDPLELRNDSRLGIPGLVEAVRGGNVVIANALGSGLVECEAILPFLPGLCQHLLGQDLALPSVATWWCGQPQQREFVTANIDTMVVKAAFQRSAMLGANNELKGLGLVTPDQRDEVLRKIATRCHDYVGQEPVILSTAPVWDQGRLRPAPMTLRVFLAATGDGYEVMPGGLVRVSRSQDPHAIAIQDGQATKDAWVQSDQPVSSFSRLGARLGDVALRRTGKDLPSRAADNLFWMGRYVERAEDTMRLLRSLVVRLNEDGRPLEDIAAMERVVAPLIKKAGLKVESDTGAGNGRATKLRRHLGALAYDLNCPYGVQDTLANLQRAASLVRDRLSLDAWRTLSALKPEGFRPNARAGWDTDLGDVLDKLDEGLRTAAAFSGMEMENMTRSHGWRFLDMGRRIERGVHMIEMLQGLLGSGEPEQDGSLVLLLDIADSFMTYRSRYLTTPLLAPVLDLLLLDETNPRSVAFQVATLYRHIEDLPRDTDTALRSAEQRIVLAVLTELRLSDIDALCKRGRRGQRKRLGELLTRVARALPELSEVLSRTYFAHANGPGDISTMHRLDQSS